MASSSAVVDYFSGRPSARTRPPPSVFANATATPGSPRTPRTPLLRRSISSQFGTPGSFRGEPEDPVIYELGARHVSAGFAGENRPRCILPFDPNSRRRAGDYRSFDPAYRDSCRRSSTEDTWGADYELYHTDLRRTNLQLVEDLFQRAVRKIHTDYLSLDQKPRKAMLVVQSLLPTPLLETVLRMLFNHFSQPPIIAILTSPTMCCVSAGVRDALVVDIGWEETVITAVGEYKEVCQRRTVRAGKMLTRETALTLEKELETRQTNEAMKQTLGDDHIPFDVVDEIVQRMAWCRSRGQEIDTKHNVMLPITDVDSQDRAEISFHKLSELVESTLLPPNNRTNFDDHDLPIHVLAYHTLLSLPVDLHVVCMSRVIITGGLGNIPGLKRRLLQEIELLIHSEKWNPVRSFGSVGSPDGTGRRRHGMKKSTKPDQQPVKSYQVSAKRDPSGSGPLQTPENTNENDPSQQESGGLDESDNASRQSPLSAEQGRNLRNSTKTAGPDTKQKAVPSNQTSDSDYIPPSQREHDDKDDKLSQKAERQANKAKDAVVKGVVRGVHTLGPWAGASIMANLRIKGAGEVEREDFLKRGLKDSLLDG